MTNLNPVWHYLQCGLPGTDGITPYIGLAYYDGADDGVYNTPTGVFNLWGGPYPNLSLPGESEYGKYIEANPIVLGINAHCTHELSVIADLTTTIHCPVDPNVHV